MSTYNFNYLNLLTTYKIEINNKDNNEKIQIEREGAPCFANFFSSQKNENVRNMSAEITIADTDVYQKEGYDNFMLISTEELEEYLSEMKKIINFDHEIERIENQGIIKVKIKTIEKTHFEHKWILSTLRDVYETPKNIAVKELFSTKKRGHFKEEENIFNVFNSILCAITTNAGGQNVAYFMREDITEALTIKETKQSIDSIKNKSDGRLNSIFPTKKARAVEPLKGALREEFKKVKSDFSEMNDPFMIDIRTKLFYSPIYNYSKEK